MGPISLVVLLISGIAWGAMPIDRRVCGEIWRGQVARGGPFTNLLIAAVTLTALGLWQRYRVRGTDELSPMAQNGEYLLWIFGGMNVSLALFNLVPCPPLDGSHILANLSHSFARTLDTMMETGMYFRIAIVLFVSRGQLHLPGGDQAGAELSAVGARRGGAAVAPLMTGASLWKIAQSTETQRAQRTEEVKDRATVTWASRPCVYCQHARVGQALVWPSLFSCALCVSVLSVLSLHQATAATPTAPPPRPPPAASMRCPLNPSCGFFGSATTSWQAR
jgi:hypothetical protein